MDSETQFWLEVLKIIVVFISGYSARIVHVKLVNRSTNIDKSILKKETKGNQSPIVSGKGKVNYNIKGDNNDVK